MIKYNKNFEQVYLIDLTDLWLSKVESISGTLEILFQPMDISGLYNYKDFVLNCNYTIRKIADNFIVKVDFSSIIPTLCDVCGSEFNYHFNSTVEEVFTTHFEYKKTIDHMYYFVFDGKELDIGKICIENFISNLPTKFTDQCS